MLLLAAISKAPLNCGSALAPPRSQCGFEWHWKGLPDGLQSATANSSDTSSTQTNLLDHGLSLLPAGFLLNAASWVTTLYEQPAGTDSPAP